MIIVSARGFTDYLELALGTQISSVKRRDLYIAVHQVSLVRENKMKMKEDQVLTVCADNHSTKNQNQCVLPSFSLPKLHSH